MSRFRVLNAFPVNFPAETLLQYRIWTIDPLPQTPVLRQKIRDELRWGLLRQPVAKTRHQGKPAFAVINSVALEPVSYSGKGERLFTISPTEVTRTVNLSSPDEGEIELVSDLLYQAVNSHLGRDGRLVRGFSSGTFFSINPDKVYHGPKEQRSNSSKSVQQKVDIYRGFSFRIGYFQGIGFCITLDVHSSYIGKESLADYRRSGSGLVGVEQDQGLTRWIIDLRKSMQDVYLIGPQNKRIADVILPDGKSIFQYIVDKYPHLENIVSPDDECATVIYNRNDKSNEEKHRSTSSTLMRPKLKLDNPKVKSLGDKPAFPADNRYERIVNFGVHLNGAKFDYKPLSIGSLANVKPLLFPSPTLLYANNQTLNLEKLERNLLNARRQWGDAKLNSLELHGPYVQKKFVNPFIVYPASLEEDGLLDRFLKTTENFCQTFGKVEFSPTLSSYRDKATLQNLKDKLKGIVQNQQAGFIMLALPDNEDDASSLYAYVKSELSIPTKCVATSTLRRKVHSGFQNYVKFNTLSMLVENEVTIWGLAEGLSYEMHFGFDVARSKTVSLMGATCINDATVKNFVFNYYGLPPNADGSLKEAIPTRTIGEYVLDHLQTFYELNQRAPTSILFHRDGRIYDEEVAGIYRAIELFTEKRNLDIQPKWSIISILKSNSMRLRLFDSDNGRIYPPLTGAYYLQSNRMGFLISSGAPNLPQGTPQPIGIELIDSSDETASIEIVMRDIYWLTHLNWSSPQITTSLPITIRFTDDKLERYITEGEAEEGDEDWD